MSYRAIFMPTVQRRTLVLETARQTVAAGETDLRGVVLARQLGVSLRTLWRWLAADPELAAELEPLWGPTHRLVVGYRKAAMAPVS